MVLFCAFYDRGWWGLCGLVRRYGYVWYGRLLFCWREGGAEMDDQFVVGQRFGVDG